MTDTLMNLVRYKIEALQMLANAEGEISPELESLLDTLSLSIPTKIDGYAAIEDALWEQAENFKSLADQAKAKAKTAEMMAESLRARIKLAMQDLGVKEVSGNLKSYKLVNAAKKLVVDESAISSDYHMLVVPASYSTPDKQRIKEALDKGEEVVGARYEQVQYTKIVLAKQPKLSKGSKDV